MTTPSQSSTSPTASRLRDITRRMTSFADLCEQAQYAANQGNVDALFELAFAARQMRHAIATNKGVTTSDFDLADVEWIADAQIASARSKSGDAILHKLHERPLPADADLLADALGIVAFTESMLPTTWNYKEDLVIFFGNGLDAPAEILRRVGQQRICVFLAEDEEPAYYHESVHILRSVLDVYKILGAWPRAPKRIVSRSLEHCSTSEEEQREAIEAAELYLGYVKVDRATSDLFADCWVSQGIENLPHTISAPSVANFDEDFVGRPMVIVAPGPSLCKNIKELHKFKGKAIICTFSHTLSSFAAEGIDPDIVLTVDSNPLVYHFKDAAVERIGALISGVTVHPDIFKLPAKHHITMGANAKFDTWLGNLLNEDFSVQGGGSVATTALALGLRWKCDPIVFMGLDLSFSNGRYYAETSCDGDLRVSTSEDGSQLLFDGWSEDCLAMTVGKEENRELARQRATLKGYDGGTVETTPMFMLFHDWFEKRTSSASDTTILNCTEGGAYIEGMQHLPLREAYERYIADSPPLRVADTFAKQAMNIDPTRRENAIAGVVAIVKSLERCLSLIGRCDSLAASIPEHPERLEKLGELEKDLIASVKVGRFMSIRKLSEIDLAYNRAAAADNLDELLAASRDLYASIREEAKQALPELKAALEHIRNRKH